MNLVDSSGWIEYFSRGPNADSFTEPILDTSQLVVPTIVLYEVFKLIVRERGESSGLLAVASMREGIIVEINEEQALNGAKLSLDHRLPMADALILACAHAKKATLWTQDDHFKELSSVRYIPKSEQPYPEPD